MDRPVAPDTDLAERAYRLAASLIDLGLVSAIWIAVTFGGFLLARVLPDFAFVVDLLDEVVALSICGVLGLVQWILLATEGTTLGKRTVGIRVVRDGEPPGFVYGVLVRRILPRLAVVPTLGLSLLADAIPIFAPDRRCVHDRLAGTQVVLDPQTREGDAPIGGDELRVRRGTRFAHLLAVGALAVAGLFGGIVLQNVLMGLVHLPGGWIGTGIAALVALALVVAAVAVYDGHPLGVIVLAVVSFGAMGLAGLWFAWLVTMLGAASPLSWIAGGVAAQVGLVAALFAQPAARLAAERTVVHERAMLDEMGLSATA